MLTCVVFCLASLVHSDVILEDDGVKFGQKMASQDFSSEKEFQVLDVSKYQTKLDVSCDKKVVSIYDNILSRSDIASLKTCLHWDTLAWRFNNFDTSKDQISQDNIPWINELNPVSFNQTKLNSLLKALVKDVSKQDVVYYPYRVVGKVIRRGDDTHVAVDSLEEGDFTVMVFLTSPWEKNDYGEIYFFDTNNDICCGVNHKSNRIVVWDSLLPRLHRPPAILKKSAQVLFQVEYSKNFDKMIESEKRCVRNKEEFITAKKTELTPPLETLSYAQNLDVAKHNVKSYTSKSQQGRSIHVYDGLFPVKMLQHLRENVLNYGSFFYSDIDDDGYSDNVQWIAGFKIDAFIASPFWPVVKKVSNDIIPDSQMFPYDVSVNLIRSFDHPRIHRDVQFAGEEEFTFLLYLSPNLTENMYGETAYFEDDEKEILAQVSPKYGRAVVFDGNIPHSGRPTSPRFTGARLTLAVKLHKNELTARKKYLKQELNLLRGLKQDIRLSKIRIAKNESTYATIGKLGALFDKEHNKKKDMDETNEKFDNNETIATDVNMKENQFLEKIDRKLQEFNEEEKLIKLRKICKKLIETEKQLRNDAVKLTLDAL